MEIELIRQHGTQGFTAGTLIIAGKEFCTIEPQERTEKIANATAIPVGRYQIIFLFSKKFGRLMPFLVDVPGFIGILIHVGNSVKDTKGCIVAGMRFNPLSRLLLRSQEAVDKILDLLLDTIYKKNQKVFITIC